MIDDYEAIWYRGSSSENHWSIGYFVLLRRRRRSERNGVENVEGLNEDRVQGNFLIFAYSGILWSIFKSASRLLSERQGRLENENTILLLFNINIYEIRQFKSTVGVPKRTDEF